MDQKLFISTFILIFVAELPDKTALATVMMATRGSPLPIFIGVAAAFVVQTVVAVIFGSFIGKLPTAWVHLGAGIIFLIFAAFAWKKAHDEDEIGDETAKAGIREPAFFTKVWSSFMVIFIAEWGDLTQLASASLVARYQDPVTIFFASIAALWSVTAIAIFIGRRLKGLIHPALLQRIAAAAFASAGAYFIYEWALGK